MTDPALPGITGPVVEALAGGWDDGGLWKDVGVLSDRFYSASNQDRSIAWHHLVLAVGNFKRQPNRRLRPGRLAAAAAGSAYQPRPTWFEIPGSRPVVVVDVSEESSWNSLMANLTGAATATTTTLLSALWPEDHFVYDWRVDAAANGLRIHAGLTPDREIDPQASRAEPLSLRSYGTVRRWLVETASASCRPLVDVERALYRLSQSVPAAKGRSWADYGNELASRVTATAAGVRHGQFQ